MGEGGTYLNLCRLCSKRCLQYYTDEWHFNTNVAKYSLNHKIILSYPLAGLFEYLFFVLVAQTSAGQAGPKFKTVCQSVYERIIQEILKRSGYFRYFELWCIKILLFLFLFLQPCWFKNVVF